MVDLPANWLGAGLAAENGRGRTEPGFEAPRGYVDNVERCRSWEWLRDCAIVREDPQSRLLTVGRSARALRCVTRFQRRAGEA